jgi:hypothetical protein
MRAKVRAHLTTDEDTGNLCEGRETERGVGALPPHKNIED